MDYRAYLLRIWREGRTSRLRLSLEEPASQRRQGFASMEAFFDFLQGEIAEGDGSPLIRDSDGEEEQRS